MRTRTYYDRHDAMVTNDQFVWHTTSAPLVFHIQHLRNVGRVQAPARIRPFAPALAGCVMSPRSPVGRCSPTRPCT